jgi:hypothetical protein
VHNNAEIIEAVKLVRTFALLNLIQLFPNRITIKKPQKIIEKRFLLAQESTKILHQLDAKQKASRIAAKCLLVDPLSLMRVRTARSKDKRN